MSNIKIGDKFRYVYQRGPLSFVNLTFGKIYEVLDYTIYSPDNIHIRFEADDGKLETLAIVCMNIAWFEKVEEIDFLDILKGY